MATILRVQNRQGKGPYAGDLAVCEWLNHGDDDHPLPLEEPLINRYILPQEHCGFINKKQLQEWFKPHELEYMATQGFYVVKVKGTITAIGQKQILFIKETP